MTTNSGKSGACRKCHHFNNEHKYTKCKAKRCKVEWKVCQSTAHSHYILCKECKDHPGGGPAGSEPDGSMRDADEGDSTSMKPYGGIYQYELAPQS